MRWFGNEFLPKCHHVLARTQTRASMAARLQAQGWTQEAAFLASMDEKGFRALVRQLQAWESNNEEQRAGAR